MQLQFNLLSKLLSNTRGLCYSAYLCFALATIGVIFATTHTFLSWIYLLCITLLCLIQHYLSIRVQFDVDLLKLAAQTQDKSAPTQISEFSLELDQALHHLGLIPQQKMGRPWTLRQQGCLRLFKFQFIFLIMQYMIFLFLIQHLI